MRRDKIPISRVLGSHGVKGEIKSLALTNVLENFEGLERIYLVEGDKEREFEVEWVRLHGQAVLFKLKGIETREEARRLKGGLIEVPKEELAPLGPGEYYWFQLIGLDVFTEEGKHLGVLEEIMDTSGHDVYMVRKEGDEILLPATHEVIREVSLERRRMIVHLLEGLR